MSEDTELEFDDEEEVSESQTYIASWDCLGFEALVNLTEERNKAIMAALASTEYKAGFNLSAMLLRARYNTQRDPEIWTFNVAGGVDFEDVKAMSEESAQALVDFIRQNGQPYYRGERNKQRRVIT